MIKELGPEGARKLMARLADLAAASNMAQVRRGHPHPLSGNFQGCIGLNLDGGRRLVVEPTAEPPPMLPDGGLDWSKVDAVRVVFIGDYHG